MNDGSTFLGLSILFSAYASASVACLLQLVVHGHLPLSGWLLLLSNASLVWLAARYLDYRMHLKTAVPAYARRRRR